MARGLAIFTLLIGTGCTSGLRETQPERTATEQLIVSCAIRESVAAMDLAPLSGKRVFLDVKGQPLQLNERSAGKSGRRKLCIVDFDGDGRRDLLVNSENADFLRNTGVEDGRTTFESQGSLGSRRLAGHTTSPTTVDWNGDGRRDLLVGAEDGYLYYLPTTQ